MIRKLSIISAFALAVSISLSLAACNVFDGLYEEGGSGEPRELLEDARIATQDGRIDDAVEYLREAHEKQPESIEVRVSLASALLTQNEIDVMLIAELAEEIGSAEDDDASDVGCPDDLVCSFDCATVRSAKPFSYGDSDAYRRLMAASSALEQVSGLMSVPLEDLGAKPGNRLSTSDDRKLLYDSLVETLSEMHRQERARQLASTLLLDAGITRLASALATIEESSAANGISLFLVERTNGSKVVDYCGADVEQFLTSTMCPVTSSALFAVDLLETRAENFTSNTDSNPSSIAGDLVEIGHELFDGLSTEEESTCNQL